MEEWFRVSVRVRVRLAREYSSSFRSVFFYFLLDVDLFLSCFFFGMINLST